MKRHTQFHYHSKSVSDNGDITEDYNKGVMINTVDDETVYKVYNSDTHLYDEVNKDDYITASNN